MQPDFVVFLDENHCRSQHILRPLSNANIEVQSFKAHFKAGTSDEEWLPFVGQRQWFLLTTDKKIRYRHLEKLAIKQSGLRMFCFTSNFSPVLMEAALAKAIPRMLQMLKRQPAPWIATITEAGLVNLSETFGQPKA